jgi:hypothetical protein
MTSPDADLLYFNGLDGVTGQYLIPPLHPEQLAAIARGEKFDPAEQNEVKRRQRQRLATFGVREGIDPTDLAQAGWGVIFAVEADPAIREALNTLLLHRRRAAESVKPRYREYAGPSGFRPADTKTSFLARLGIGPGPVDPDKVPYYLLIVGDPETIPYGFQSQLDVAYAVGRVHFESVDEYARYAQSVVEAETSAAASPKRAVFFGAQNNDDPATSLSAEHLVAPLAAAVATEHTGWQVDTVLAAEATKERLGRILGGDQTPTVVFTAGHGMGFPSGDPRQLRHQGALVCQDWPGPLAAPVEPASDWYFSADDVTDDARPAGLICFHFACFGAGTPKLDEFAHLGVGSRQPTEIAPSAFVAALPQRLLAHPNGGALAVIGHVERAWGTSFQSVGAGDQLTVFQSTLARLMTGQPVGHAVDYFNARYAELSTTLSSELEEVWLGKHADPLELDSLWTSNNDARGYAVIGDPAVHLNVGPA